ncbi:MAG: beta-propeller domain-containing protein, partial [Eubacteriales bacterium]|nr:beta-propeller domain-containing protein [Eubacteriales bacterium]
MFKEQYIRDNDKLKAKETLLMEIKEKNTREKIALTPRQKFVRYGAVFAAFLLVAVSVFGIINANKGTSATPENVALSAEAASDAAQGSTVESYDDIYGMIEAIQTRSGYYAGGMMTESAVSDGAMAAPATEEARGAVAMEAPVASDGGLDYSETNVQVKGVDEADIVKTDGSYIYYIAGNQLNILKPDGASTRLVSSTPLSGEDSWWGYNSEMFLLGNRLMIITQSFNTVWVNDAS